MKKRIKHLMSLFAFVIFLFLAFAQLDEDTGEPIENVPCDEAMEVFLNMGYLPCDKVDPSIKKIIDYHITLKDKISGELIQGIFYDTYWMKLLLANDDYCEGVCAGYPFAWFYTPADGFGITEQNGTITSNPHENEFTDAKERVVVKINLSDPSNRYSSKIIYLRYTHDTNPIQTTFYLLKNDAL